MNLRTVEDAVEKTLVLQLREGLLLDSVALVHSQVPTLEKQGPSYHSSSQTRLQIEPPRSLQKTHTSNILPLTPALGSHISRP